MKLFPTEVRSLALTVLASSRHTKGGWGIRGISMKSLSPFRVNDTICIGRSIKMAIALTFGCNALAINGQLNGFFCRLLKSQGREPRWVITDKL